MFRSAGSAVDPWEKGMSASGDSGQVQAHHGRDLAVDLLGEVRSSDHDASFTWYPAGAWAAPDELIRHDSAFLIWRRSLRCCHLSDID